jgi:ComF family protein
MFICRACESAIPRNHTFFCSLCLARLPDGILRCHPRGFLFGAATEYREDAVRELILILKFKAARNAAEPLARMLAGYLREVGASFSDALLIPIPLSRERERERGFNQVEHIAKIAGAELSIAVAPHILRRTRNTKPQSEIRDHRERKDNVSGAFVLTDAGTVGGRTVIVVDDVRTSGATLAEAVRTLRSANPKRVIGVVVARA